MQPVLQELKQKTGDGIVILKVDVDKNPETAAAYQIQGVPALIPFRKGQMAPERRGICFVISEGYSTI